MIFVGNNALQLRDLKMSAAKCMGKDLLAVIMMKPLTKRETLRIIARGIFRTLENDEKLDTFCVDELTIHLAPVFLGFGTKLFDRINAGQVKLKPLQAVHAPLVTHLTYEVAR